MIKGDFKHLVDLPFDALMAFEVGKNTIEDYQYRDENVLDDLKNVPRDILEIPSEIKKIPHYFKRKSKEDKPRENSLESITS